MYVGRIFASDYKFPLYAFIKLITKIRLNSKEKIKLFFNRNAFIWNINHNQAYYNIIPLCY